MKDCEHFYLRKSGNALACCACDEVVYIEADGVYARLDVLISNESAEKYAGKT